MKVARIATAGVLITLAGIGTSCQGMDPGKELGRDHVIGEPGPFGQGPGTEAPPGPGPLPAIGVSCRTNDPSDICLAVKVVTYKDPSTGRPTVSQDEAIANVRAINQIWSQCKIGFQMEQYLAIHASDYGFAHRTNDSAELDRIRSVFVDSGTLLLVTTGSWNRSGSLGRTQANAWTTMPGAGPFGVVMESPVGLYANLIAHELGHYINLPHVNDTSGVMNPIIYTSSKGLNAGQCSSARQAAAYFWLKMYR